MHPQADASHIFFMTNSAMNPIKESATIIPTWLSVSAIILLVWVCAGYAVYRFQKLPRFEDGIIFVVTWFVKTLIDFFRETPGPSQMRDETLILSSKELNALTGELEKLYDAPSIDDCPDSGGVFTIQISAIDLQPRYKDVSPSDIREIAGRLVVNYYRKIRERTPFCTIPVATRDRLTVEIALSAAGEQSMRQKQAEIEARQARQEAARPKPNREPLTIEIDDDENEEDWFEVPVDARIDEDDTE